MSNLFEELSRVKTYEYTEEDVRKIFGENTLRVIREVTGK